MPSVYTYQLRAGRVVVYRHITDIFDPSSLRGALGDVYIYGRRGPRGIPAAPGGDLAPSGGGRSRSSGRGACSRLFAGGRGGAAPSAQPDLVGVSRSACSRGSACSRVPGGRHGEIWAAQWLLCLAPELCFLFARLFARLPVRVCWRLFAGHPWRAEKVNKKKPDPVAGPASLVRGRLFAGMLAPP